MDTTSIISLQDTHRSKDSHVRELTSQVLSLQSELVSLRKKMADTEAQTPQMQEAKKAAVAGVCVHVHTCMHVCMGKWMGEWRSNVSL